MSFVLDLSTTYTHFEITLGHTFESVFSCRNLVVINKLLEGCPVVEDLQITDLLLGEFKILSNFVKDNVLNLQRGRGLLDRDRVTMLFC